MYLYYRYAFVLLTASINPFTSLNVAYVWRICKAVHFTAGCFLIGLCQELLPKQFISQFRFSQCGTSSPREQVTWAPFLFSHCWNMLNVRSVIYYFSAIYNLKLVLFKLSDIIIKIHWQKNTLHSTCKCTSCLHCIYMNPLRLWLSLSVRRANYFVLSFHFFVRLNTLPVWSGNFIKYHFEVHIQFI